MGKQGATKGRQRASNPKGLYPQGSAAPIRGNADKLSAKDVPIEVPVYVYYERHISPPAVGKSRSGRKLDDMPKAGQLLGWTTTVDCFTFGRRVLVKIGHSSDALEVVVEDYRKRDVEPIRQSVYKSKGKQPPGLHTPPATMPAGVPPVLPRFDTPSNGQDDDDDFVEE